jgi:hypothetical protein|tara:strand:- start:325 stop:831 length:507 start_codon:yes stop_codon:yes gene_type:complete
MSFVIEMVKKEDVLSVWPDIKHHADNLQKRSYGRYVTADIFDQIVEQPCFLWVVKEDENIIAFFICSVSYYPRKTYLDLNTLSGLRVNEWGDQALEALEDFGRELNVDGLETNTAVAFEKTWKKRGFKKEFVTMTREIGYQDQEEDEEAVDLFEFDSGDMLKEVANGS